MDVYDFNNIDAISHFSGMSHTTLKSYAKYAPTIPECAGGSLTCVKRDIHPKHIDNAPDHQKLIPVVLCLNCEIKSDCVFGRTTEIGFYFIFESLENQPMKTKFIKREIINKKILDYLKDTGLNIWKDRRFHRR